MRLSELLRFRGLHATVRELSALTQARCTLMVLLSRTVRFHGDWILIAPSASMTDGASPFHDAGAIRRLMMLAAVARADTGHIRRVRIRGSGQPRLTPPLLTKPTVKCERNRRASPSAFPGAFRISRAIWVCRVPAAPRIRSVFPVLSLAAHPDIQERQTTRTFHRHADRAARRSEAQSYVQRGRVVDEPASRRSHNAVIVVSGDRIVAAGRPRRGDPDGRAGYEPW